MKFGRSEKNIVKFGFTSLLTDVSSEMIAPVLPLFMGSVLGLDKVLIGLVEGIAESTASLAKLLSGWLSDRLPRRKPIIIAGYGLAAVAKPFLFLATRGRHVVGARFADRLGKGIRTSPRDALLAESVSPERRGLAFGFHRAMDSAGAIIGPGIAALFLALGARHHQTNEAIYRSIFLWAFVPAILSVIILLTVREVARSASDQAASRSCDPSKPECALGRPFYVYLGACALFTLGNSSDAFIYLRAQNLGVGLALIPLLSMLQNGVNTAVATPAGWVSDRLGRKGIIVSGLVFYALVYAGLGAATRSWHVWPLMAAYGLYYGFVEGSFRAFVADLVPRERLGTAFGLYHTVVGVSLLPASLLTGFLWERFSPRVAFLTGSFLALAAAVIMLGVRGARRGDQPVSGSRG